MTEFTSNDSTPTQKHQNPYLVPGAILLSAVFVSLSILYSGGLVSIPSSSLSGAVTENVPVKEESIALENIVEVNQADHIKGNPNAPVRIVEFSDTECPFCKRFHATMQQIVQEYDGQVAWVYRHFPLDKLHAKARREAAAAELAGELGGNDKFWQYLDKIFEITPSNDGLDLNLLPQIAQEIGLPREPFEQLISTNDLRGGKFADHIEADYQDALVAGGRGTPYSVIIASNGKKFVVSGAQPYESVKAAVEEALNEK